MQLKEHGIATPDPIHNGAAFQDAVEVVQTGASKAAAGTEKMVRRYPLAAVGLSLAAGVGLGVMAHRLIAGQRRPAPWFERLGAAALVATAARGLGKLF